MLRFSVNSLSDLFCYTFGDLRELALRNYNLFKQFKGK